MLKKRDTILLPIILFVVLVLVFAPSQKYVRRLLHIPKLIYVVENSDSELLGLLLDESSFTNNWYWDQVITYQGNHSNSNPNIQEWTNRQLIGYHNGHEVFLFHTITRYFESIDEIDIKPLANAIGVESYKDQISISIPQDSTFLPVDCHIGFDTQETQVTECILSRKNELTQEKINAVVYGNADIKEVSQMIRNMVLFLDNKEAVVQ